MRLFGAVCPFRPRTAAGTMFRPARDAALATRNRRRLHAPPERCLEEGRGFILAPSSLGSSPAAANPAVAAAAAARPLMQLAVLGVSTKRLEKIPQPSCRCSDPRTREALQLVNGPLSPRLCRARACCRRPQESIGLVVRWRPVPCTVIHRKQEEGASDFRDMRLGTPGAACRKLRAMPMAAVFAWHRGGSPSAAMY